MLSITSRELFKAHGGSQRWWNNYDTTGGRISFYQSAKRKRKKKESIAMHGDYYREKGKSDGEYWENSNFEMGVDR